MRPWSICTGNASRKWNRRYGQCPKPEATKDPAKASKEAFKVVLGTGSGLIDHRVILQEKIDALIGRSSR